MKTITTLVTVMFLAASCTSRNNVENAVQNNVTSEKMEGIKNSGAGSDTSFISVVHPLINRETITVGGRGADITDCTSAGIQTAIDVLHKRGGGTVKLLETGFVINAPVRLYSNISLVGSGANTVLKKCTGFHSSFAIDADYGELQVTVTDASGFRPGMGVAIYDDDQRSGWALTTARIVTIKGNTIFLDDYLLRDYRADKNGTISNACSVVEAIGADNIRISDLTIDGSLVSNEMIDGCRAGGVYIHKSANAVVENVTVRNFNSDGISWQITEHVTVRNCEVYGCANSGLHPGTGSPYSLVEGNRSHDNGGYGLFVCWRVRNSIVRNNIFYNNGRNGICTGHKDTDVLFAGNHIYDNGSDGINLRGESDLNAPHRSVFRDNTIENNGTKGEGYGLSVNCKAEGVVLENNIIRNTGNGKQIAAVMIRKGALPVNMISNSITGHPKGEVVQE
jgi:hypothetical protein